MLSRMPWMMYSLAIGTIVVAISISKLESKADSCMIVQCDGTGCYTVDQFCLPYPPPVPIGGCYGCHAIDPGYRNMFGNDDRGNSALR